MGFEIASFAVISLIIVFIIERLYRQVTSNEILIEKQMKAIEAIEEKTLKHSAYIKRLAEELLKDKNQSDPDSLYKPDEMTKCPNCNRFYLTTLKKCPFCKP